MNFEKEDIKIRMPSENDIAHESSSDEKGRTDRAIVLQDMPEDLIERILSLVSIQTLLSFQQTCKLFHAMTNQPSFWEVRFRDLLRTKLFIPRKVTSSFRSNPRESYKLAYMDRFRNTIEQEELTGRVWYFWFKWNAGEEWTRWDTFWVTKGRSCRKVVFLDDGNVLECTCNPYHYEDDDSGGGIHKSDRIRLRDSPSSSSSSSSSAAAASTTTETNESSISDISSIKRLRTTNGETSLEGTPISSNSRSDFFSIVDPSTLQPVFYNEPNVPNRIVMKWRFITHPLDFRPREKDGGYIRLLVGEREVPTYVVRRLSHGNWGFILESCWGIFCSFDVTTQNNNNSIHFNSSNRDDTYIKSFRDDPQWNTITTEKQWKEAMLYNNGANTLPENNRY
jgi:hypothetical protein